MRGLTMMFPNKTRRGSLPLVGDYRLAGSRLSVLPGRGVVIEPQAQVIYQGVHRMILPPLTMRACHNRRVMISDAVGFTQRMAYCCWCHANVDLNYYHDPHATEIEEDGSTIVTMR